MALVAGIFCAGLADFGGFREEYGFDRCGNVVRAGDPTASTASDDSAKEPQQIEGTDEPDEDPDMKTLGGRQFWGDVLYFHDWRIQKNVFTGRYRLLDGSDYRHASGTLQECRDRLEEIKQEENLGPMSGPGVILIHGIIRSSKSFSRMRNRLKAEGYTVFGFDYPSTQVEIQEAAEYLHQVIESLEGIDDLYLVVHSMGGLVVRAYLIEHRDPRIRRMVMLGVPNLGATMADRLRNQFLYKTIFGPAGQQLISDRDGVIAQLPTPDFEFAIIAGGRGNERGYNPLVDGDDDGTISVACNRLPGAADFAVVPYLHSFMMFHQQTIDQTIHFLKTGRLSEHRDPEPIPRTGDRVKADEEACDRSHSAEPTT